MPFLCYNGGKNKERNGVKTAIPDRKFSMKKPEQNALTPTRADCEAHIRATLPPRPVASHKGTFGRAHLFCGSAAYTGAALLSSEGALRMGVGLTYLYTAREAAEPARARLPELIIRELSPIALGAPDVTDALLAADGVILIGPGISQTDARGNPADPTHFAEMLSQLLSRTGGAVVLDADALNLLARGTPDAAALLRTAKRDIVITPHPTEFERLFGIKPTPDTNTRVAAACDFAAKSGATVILKGAGTVIVSPDGVATVNPSGSSALSKGGTGDVLSGMLTALLAMKMPPYDAARAAVYLHGAAGDTLAASLSDFGVLPSELPIAAAKELKRILEK